MSTDQPEPAKLVAGVLNDAAVAEFLQAEPDFFQRHPQLLASLNLPHTAGNAISLIERQVAVLRDRNMTMRRKMHELIAAGQENDALFAKVRSLTLAMLDVADWIELNEIYATFLLVDFKADFVCCHLQQGANRQPGRYDHIIGHQGTPPEQHLVPGGDPVCTPLRLKELKNLFPAYQFEQDNEMTATGSAVLIPLNVHPGGFLAIGSRDASRFTSDLDTLFVSYISDLVSHVTARLLL